MIILFKKIRKYYGRNIVKFHSSPWEVLRDSNIYAYQLLLERLIADKKKRD